MMYRIILLLIFCVTHSSQLWADVQVQGYLNSAALENLASDPSCVVPANCPDGRIYWNTTSNEPRIYNGTTWQQILIGSSSVPDPLLLSNGLEVAPTYSFTSQTGTGLWRTTNELISSVNGVQRLSARASGASTVFEVGTTAAAGIARLDLLTDGAGSNDSEIAFGDAADANIGRIVYDHSSDDMLLYSGAALRLNVGSVLEPSVVTRGPNGSDGTPSYSFSSDPDSGMYLDGGTVLRFAHGGEEGFGVQSKRVFIGDPDDGPTTSSAAAPGIAWAGDTSTGIFRAVDHIGITEVGSTSARFFGGLVELRIPNFAVGSTGMCSGGSNGVFSVGPCSSSLRYKENVQDVTQEETNRIMDLRPVSFDWKNDGRRDYGMIAEELAQVFPEIAEYNSEKTEVNGINYRHLTAILVAHNQSMQKEINDLRQRLEVLEAQ